MINLFCLPYAGSSASFYYGWKKHLNNSSVNIRPVELSGRGRRFNEPLYDSIPHAVDDVLRSIENEITTTPYMLFGHSMGSLLSYELYYRLIERKGPLPLHIFFSGKRPPNFKGKILSNLPEDQFLEEIRDFGGTPSDFFKNEELLSIFLPILKSDMHNVDIYQYKERAEKLDCTIDVFYGRSDHLTPYEDMMTWSAFANKEVTFHAFEGNHFFIHENVTAITEMVNERADLFLNRSRLKAMI